MTRTPYPAETATINMQLLKSMDIFSVMSEYELDNITRGMQRSEYKKKDILLAEGEIGTKLFILESGRAKVIVTDDHDSELILYTLEPGAVIGDISVLDGSPRSATVVATEPTVAYSVAKDAFLQLVRDNPDLALLIIQSLTQRLRHETESVRSLALESVYRRLCKKLIELSDTDDDGICSLPHRYSHYDLARMIGSSREMVTKIFSELTKGQYICVNEQRIQILRKLPSDR